MLRPYLALLLLVAPFALRSDPEPANLTFAPQINVVSTTTAAPVVLPPAAPPAADRPSCPPPRTDAPFVAPKFDEDIEYVQPAPSNAGWIAAWNEEHVFVSYDAGATFHRALDGEGHVRSASFDCWGHLVVARGDRIGVRDGEREAWHTAGGLGGDADAPRAVIGGGPDIVVVGSASDPTDAMRAAISSDGGVSWRFHDIHPGGGAERLQGQQRADGTIDIAYSIGDCMSDDLVAARIAHGEVAIDNATLAEGTAFRVDDDVILTDGGWLPRAGGTWQAYPFAHWATPVAGARPVIVAGDKTYAFAHGHVRELPLVVEGQPQAVDLAGRIWSVACGTPLVARRTPTGTAEKCEVGD